MPLQLVLSPTVRNELQAAIKPIGTCWMLESTQLKNWRNYAGPGIPMLNDTVDQRFVAAGQISLVRSEPSKAPAKENRLMNTNSNCPTLDKSTALSSYHIQDKLQATTTLGLLWNSW